MKRMTYQQRTLMTEKERDQLFREAHAANMKIAPYVRHKLFRRTIENIKKEEVK